MHTITIIEMVFCLCCGEWVKNCSCPEGPLDEERDIVKIPQRRLEGCRHPKWEIACEQAKSERENRDG